MSQLQYSIVGNGEEKFVTVFVPGGDAPKVAGSDHPNWLSIITALTEGDYGSDQEVVDLFDPAATITRKFERLSDRISVSGGKIYLDGEEVQNALTTQILRFMDEGVQDWEPLVTFYENLLANPQDHARDQLYRWLDTHDFTITPEGYIVGYKGVQRNPDGSLVSITAGPAIVDGVEVDGQVPNEIGSIIEMARGEVVHDPRVACSVGLHVGTWAYAHDFAQGAVLEVHVNPRDVVSVPTDCGSAKIRCCRYTVVGILDAPYSSALLDVDGSRDDDDLYVDSDEDDIELEECEDCGSEYDAALGTNCDCDEEDEEFQRPEPAEERSSSDRPNIGRW